MVRVGAVTARFEADGVDRGVDLGHAEELLDLIAWVALRTSIASQPKLRACSRRSGIMSPTITTAAPSSCAEVRRCEADRPSAGDVDGRAWPDTGGVGAVETGREDVESMVRSRIFSIAWSLSGNLSRFQSA